MCGCARTHQRKRNDARSLRCRATLARARRDTSTADAAGSRAGGAAATGAPAADLLGAAPDGRAPVADLRTTRVNLARARQSRRALRRGRADLKGRAGARGARGRRATRLVPRRAAQLAGAAARGGGAGEGSGRARALRATNLVPVTGDAAVLRRRIAGRRAAHRAPRHRGASSARRSGTARRSAASRRARGSRGAATSSHAAGAGRSLSIAATTRMENHRQNRDADCRFHGVPAIVRRRSVGDRAGGQ